MANLRTGTIGRYLTRELLGFLGLFLVSFIFIFLVVDFIEKIDNFIESGSSAGDVIGYFIYKIPYISIQMIPVATLLSVIVVFSLMKKRNEITALKACGISVFQIARPVIIIASIVSIALFLFSELIVPYTSSRSNDIWDLSVHRRGQPRLYGRNNIWYKGRDSIYWIGRFDPERGSMEECTFYFFGSPFGLDMRLDTPEAQWDGKNWRVPEGIIQKKDEKGVYRLQRVSDYKLPIEEVPQDFIKKIRKPEEMSYWNLRDYASRIEREGYDATRYLVDMNIKLAFPVVNLVMVLLGIPIVLRLNRGGTPAAVAAGIGACFLYLVALGLSRSLGLSGILPPPLSAWTANLVFILAGIYMMMHVET